jgi:cysteine desulfurase
MLPFFRDNFANSASNHPFGKKIKKDVDQARVLIGEIIGASPNDIILTSGATESINLAIKGLAFNAGEKRHIITIQTEHKAVLDTCKYLETIGFEIDYIGVDSEGMIDLSYLESILREDTLLVCVMYANNETGVIQNIREIGAIVRNSNALFMSDATQAIGKLNIDAEEDFIDIMCYSAHKFYGPKGIGALYLNRRRVNRNMLTPLVHGGGQENGLRSGTLNVPSIIGFAKACEISNQELPLYSEKVKSMRDFLESEFMKINGAIINGQKTTRLNNTTNVSFENIDANVFIGQLNSISISNGSACNSSVFEPSHVLMAMGIQNDRAYSSLRFSVGKFNTMDEIKTTLNMIHKILNINYHA